MRQWGLGRPPYHPPATSCLNIYARRFLTKQVDLQACQGNVRRQHGLATGRQSTRRPDSSHSPESDRTVQARHLLRSFLRECTYLPDSFARDWTRQHVIQRFRTYGFKAWKHRDDPAFEERLRSKHREARQAVGQLRRANEGDRWALLKVLLMAYGRTGKRRHELMLPLLPVAGREEHQKLVKISEESIDGFDSTRSAQVEDADPPRAVRGSRPTMPSAKDVNQGQWAPYAPELTPQLRALLQSQIRYPPLPLPGLRRATLRRLHPRIDELNAWLQPMPQSRVKNQVKQWYADLLEKVHSPLPTQEWYRLRDLALGVSSERLIPRRKTRGQSGRDALELVVMYGKPNALRAFGNRDAHRITPRFMQRVWAQVFSQCPLMDWDVDKQQWKVVWGEHALHGLGAGRESQRTTPSGSEQVSEDAADTEEG